MAEHLSVPKPEFYMLYNGKSSYPQKGEMYLSGSFTGVKPGEVPPLELVVNVVNINYSSGSEFLDKNKDLREYSLFVEKVQKKQENGLYIEEAIRQTVKECLTEGVLLELLKEHEGEVEKMFSLIYDEDLAKKYAREEGWEEGREEGREEGIKLSAKVIQALKQNVPVSEIAERYKISAYEIEELRSII